MQNPPSSDRLRRPQQRRSQETLRRLLDAAEALLDEGSFDEVSIVEIAERAERSVGAFYARFDSKEALFAALRSRVIDELDQTFFGSVEALDWAALPLEERLHLLLTQLAGLYRRHRGVLRALSLRVRAPSKSEAEQRDVALNEALFQRGIELLATDDQLEGAEGVRFRLGLSIIAAALRENIFFGDAGLSANVDDESLVLELTRCFIAYLDAPPLPAPRHPNELER